MNRSCPLESRRWADCYGTVLEHKAFRRETDSQSGLASLSSRDGAHNSSCTKLPTPACVSQTFVPACLLLSTLRQGEAGMPCPGTLRLWNRELKKTSLLNHPVLCDRVHRPGAWEASSLCSTEQMRWRRCGQPDNLHGPEKLPGALEEEFQLPG